MWSKCKKIGVGATLLASVALAPIIPAGNGLISIAVFRDNTTGEQILLQQSDIQYELMGKEGGTAYNPKKDNLTWLFSMQGVVERGATSTMGLEGTAGTSTQEVVKTSVPVFEDNDTISLFSYLTPKAEAAVVRTAHANLVTNAGASVNSLTYAFDCAGGSTLIASSYNAVNTAGDTTGVTYNAVSTTKVGLQARPGQNREIGLWAVHSPSAGSNNVVVSRTTTATTLLASAVICYSGTDTAVAIPTVTSNDAKSSNASSVNSITLTLANGAGAAVYGIFQSDDGPGQSAGTGMTILSSSDITSEFVSSPEPGGASQAVTGNAAVANMNANMDMIVVGIEATASASSVTSDIILFQ